MDQTLFDRIARLLGGARSRRGALAALAGLAAGGTALDAEARKRRRCRRDSPPGQCCRKDGTCTCKDGGTVCGVNCCRMGQECREGQCVAMPNPDTCIAFGQPCKNAGIPCCENLQCASGQGGTDDVACWVRKTGRCTSTAECVYGTTCEAGVCTGTTPEPSGCSATGGDSVSEAGGYRVHRFTTVGQSRLTFAAPCPSVDFLVVAGGGGGGGGLSAGGGGGGAGGMLEGSMSVAAGAVAILVGAGGDAGVAGTTAGGDGEDSAFAEVSAIGGGGGGIPFTAPDGLDGASGGGGGGEAKASPGIGGQGTGPQGNDGGSGVNGYVQGGGGGGADAVGATPTLLAGGAGGSGRISFVDGQRYAGGGGGGAVSNATRADGGAGGGGQGGNGSAAGAPGESNTGGGGGGGGGLSDYDGGPGGSGVVIVRYRAGS